MLVDCDAVATIPVRDLDTAGEFYEETLGLEPLGPEDPTMRVYKSGHTKIFVYESEFAGTNQATAVTWSLGDDFDRVVRTLQSDGVAFEHYQFPDTRLEGDVHVMGDMRVAWFKDPDGNIHSLVNQ
jgi:catechol 2,3-dioxygenase-like lactoylglutathione lyase family enzyme